MNVPAGKKVFIKQGSSNVVGVPLILTEDVTLNLSSNFESIFGGEGNSLVTLASGIAQDIGLGGFSTVFKGQGFRVWKSTEPLSVNLTFTFHVGINEEYNPYTEVVLPAKKLASLALPGQGSAGNLIPPGPSISSVFFPDASGVKGRILSVQIGNIVAIDNAVIEKAEPTFSKEMMRGFDGVEYPMSAKVNLDIKSVVIATTNMLGFSGD